MMSSNTIVENMSNPNEKLQNKDENKDWNRKWGAAERSQCCPCRSRAKIKKFPAPELWIRHI